MVVRPIRFSAWHPSIELLRYGVECLYGFMYCKKKNKCTKKSDHQRHTLRDRRPSTAFCPVCWTMVTRDIHTETAALHNCLPRLLGEGPHILKWCTGRKVIFCTGLKRAPRQDKSLLYQYDKPNEPTKERPFHLNSFCVPIHLSFNSQQGPI
jgi:hypothetical protein